MKRPLPPVLKREKICTRQNANLCLPSGETRAVAKLPNGMWQPSMSQNKTVLGYERQATKAAPSRKSTAHTQSHFPDLNTRSSSASYRKLMCTGSSYWPTPLRWPQKSTNKEVRLSALPFFSLSLLVAPS